MKRFLIPSLFVAFLLPFGTYAAPGDYCDENVTCQGADVCSSNAGPGRCQSVDTGPAGFGGSGGSPIDTGPAGFGGSQSAVNNGGNGNSVGLINPLSAGTSLEKLLANILAIVIRLGTIVIILMLVYIGYLFATSSINPKNIQEARTALMWTIVGALILLGAQAIALGIEATVKAVTGP